MLLDLDQLFDYLSGFNSEACQQIGIETGKKIRHFTVFFRPLGEKHVWENCAKILISKSDEELSPYYGALFEWLQDMNWPGAELIYDRLIKVKDPELSYAYHLSIKIAKQSKDVMWEEILNGFQSDYINGKTYR